MKPCRFVRAIGVVVAVSVMGACASDGDPSTDAAAADTPGETTSSEDAIRVGFAGQQTGTVAFPGPLEGAEVAVEYLNEELGGIGGRPIELVTCDLKSTPQDAQVCAQQFADDGDLALVLMPIALNGPAIYPALGAAGVPILGGLPVTDADLVSEAADFYFPGSAAFQQAVIDAIVAEDPSSVAYLYQDQNPSSVEGEARTAEVLRDAGVEMNSVSYDPSAADVLPQVTTVGAADADVLFISGAAGECAQVASALKVTGAAPGVVVTNDACLDKADVTASPDLYEGWKVIANSQLPSIGEGKSEDVDVFLKAWKDYGPGTDPAEIPTMAEVGWGIVVALQGVLGDVEPTDADAVRTSLKEFAGPVSMGGSVDCPGPEHAPAECSQGLVSYVVEGGSLTPAAD